MERWFISYSFHMNTTVRYATFIELDYKLIFLTVCNKIQKSANKEQANILNISATLSLKINVHAVYIVYWHIRHKYLFCTHSIDSF